MLSQLFYTRTVHRHPTGESKSNVAYWEASSSIWRQAADLRDDVEVGDEGALEDDGDVGGVEELDGVAAVLATVARRLDRQVDTEALMADNNW